MELAFLEAASCGIRAGIAASCAWESCLDRDFEGVKLTDSLLAHKRASNVDLSRDLKALVGSARHTQGVGDVRLRDVGALRSLNCRLARHLQAVSAGEFVFVALFRFRYSCHGDERAKHSFATDANHSVEPLISLPLKFQLPLQSGAHALGGRRAGKFTFKLRLAWRKGSASLILSLAPESPDTDPPIISVDVSSVSATHLIRSYSTLLRADKVCRAIEGLSMVVASETSARRALADEGVICVITVRSIDKLPTTCTSCLHNLNIDQPRTVVRRL